MNDKNTLSFDEMLFIALNPSKANDFAVIKDKILEKLTDETEVKKNVSSGKNFLEYKEFFERYRSEMKAEKAIERYLQELEYSRKVGNEVFQYRIQFIIDKYDNMTFETRSRIADRVHKKTGVRYAVDADVKKDGVRAVLTGADKSTKISRIAELISEEVDPKGKPKEKEIRIMRRSDLSKYFSYAQTISLIWMIIIGAGLAFIPVFSAIVLGENVFVRVLAFFKTYHFIAILYVGLLNIVAYLINLKISNRYIKDSFRKGVRISFFFGFLPMLLYVLGYVGVYFL